MKEVDNMNRVFLKGDCHGRFIDIIDFIETYNLGFGDFIIVLGDMGLFWDRDEIDADSFIKYYEDRYEVNLMFIDGNHENFDILKTIPIGEDGQGHISKHITYLSRGCTFDLCGKKFLCMGGADSVDRIRRINHISWWEDEKILQSDIDKVDKSISYDYILTHAAPQSIVNNHKWELCKLLYAESLIDHSSEGMLDQMMQDLKFKKWYFGHYHSDVALDDKFTCLYHDFIELE